MLCTFWSLAKKAPFADESLTLEAARTVAFAHALVNDRVTVQEYACLVVQRSAQYYEGIALARVAPKVRRDALARDAEEDVGIRRLSTEHDGGDFDYADDGAFGEDTINDTDRSNCPEKPVDKLTEADWKRAWQFARTRPPRAWELCCWTREQVRLSSFGRILLRLGTNLCSAWLGAIRRRGQTARRRVRGGDLSGRGSQPPRSAVVVRRGDERPRRAGTLDGVEVSIPAAGRWCHRDRVCT